MRFLKQKNEQQHVSKILVTGIASCEYIHMSFISSRELIFQE